MSLILLLYSCVGVSQDGGQVNFNTASEINNLIKLPKSPEAAALEKYGSTPVNLYTGTPEISIPLHDLKGREVSIPISLNYDASGVKVNQIATNVGLGWSLNMGGRITRISNGIPDDILNNPYTDQNNTDILYYKENGMSTFSGEYGLMEYLQFMLDAVNGQRDTLLDFYSLNVLGISDYIVRDLETMQYHTLLNPNIIVSKSHTGWKVEIEDGTIYNFVDAEYTDISHLGGDDTSIYTGVSASSWLLNKVISKNKIDIFDLEYKYYTWQNNVTQNISSKSYSYNDHVFPQLVNSGLGYNLDVVYKTSQMVPYTVKLNNEILVKFEYKNRDDLVFVTPCYQNGNALDKIVFYNYKTPTALPTYSKSILFEHGYFGTGTNKRLKLNDIIFYQNDLLNGKKFSFEYDRPDLVPSITSFSQDYLGLYNSSYNSNLVPPVYNENDVALTSGANRSPNFNAMTIGTLNKIIYPSKGYTNFIYEQNEIANNRFIPTYETIIEEELTYNSSIRYDLCSYDEDYGGYNNPLMHHIYPYSYENGSSCYQNLISFNGSTGKTSFLRITEQTNAHIEIGGGEGVYLIQRIENCNSTEDIDVVCSDTGYSTFYNPCLNPLETIYYTGTSSSHPNNFVLGGLAGCSTYDSILLPVGTYQITVWARANEDIWSGTYIRLYKNTPTTVPAHWLYASKKIDGFRIKEIKDYSASNILATTKSYKYSEDLNNESCSGIQLSFIEPYSSSRSRACNLNNGNFEVETLSVKSAYYDSNPHVAYSSVIVTDLTENGVNGYEQTIFNIGKSGLENNKGVTSFNPNYDNGKIKEKHIYDKDKTKLKFETYLYNKTDFFEETSFTFNKNPYSSYAYAYSPNWGLQFDYGHCDLTSIGVSNNLIPFWVQTNGVNIPDWSSNLISKYSFHGITQNIRGEYGYLSRKETTDYFQNNTEVKRIEDFIYSEYPFRLEEKTTTVTNNITKSEQYQYHPDYPINPEKITDIIYFNDGEQIFHKNMVYSDYGTTTNGIANMISEIKTAKGVNPLESRLLFDYDSTTKNILNTVVPLATTLSNDNYDSYIFGYNDMYPVAKLSGVKYSQISYQRLANIKAKSDVIISPSNDLALRNELNLLRSDFPNAQITTYTYDPVIGVTSITDPKGDVQYFSYDELSRIKEVKDKNGNKLSENEYHYRPQN